MNDILIKFYSVFDVDGADSFDKYNKTKDGNKKRWLYDWGAYTSYINASNIVGLAPYYGNINCTRIFLRHKVEGVRELYVYGHINSIAKRINKALNKKEDL